MKSLPPKRCNVLYTVEPLRKRVPKTDEDGNLLCDFMMLLPNLRNHPKHIILEKVDSIQYVCSCYSNEIVFAEINIPLNLLWVSYKYKDFICKKIAAEIQRLVPEAKLIG